MEENNNNEKTVVDKTKEAITNEGKKIGKAAAKSIVTWAAPAIGIFVLILLFVGLLNAVTFFIFNAFTNFFNPSSGTVEGNVADSTESGIYSLVTINEHGGYDINLEGFSEQIVQQLEEQGVDTEQMGLSITEFENMLDDYVKAEIQTMYPKTGKQGDMDGLIVFKRADAETKKITTLTYRPYDEYIGLSGEELFNSFTIKPDEPFGNIYVATKEIIENYNYDGSETGELIKDGELEPKETVNTNPYDYKTVIQNYGLPFNFLISLHMITQDVDFMKSVVNEITSHENPIEITFIETTSIQSYETVYSGSKEIYVTVIEPEPEKEKVPLPDKGNTGSEDIKIENWKDNQLTPTTRAMPSGTIENNEPKTELESKTEINNTTKKNMNLCSEYLSEIAPWKQVKTKKIGTLFVTNADTVLKKITKELDHQDIEEKLLEETTEQKIIDNESKELDVSEEDKTNNIVARRQILNLYETVTYKVNNKRYSVVDKESKIKIEEFKQLIEKYPQAKDNLTSAPSYLIYLLQQNENTQQTEMLMRYILFALTGNDYGVTSEEELDYLFFDRYYEYVNTFGSLKEYNRYWEESELRPKTNIDGSKYIIQQDNNGNLVVGYGLVLDAEYKNQLILGGYSTQIGSEIDKDFIDGLEEQKLQSLTEQVETALSGITDKNGNPVLLKKYQINALVSRAYNSSVEEALFDVRGDSKWTFEEAYKATWNQAEDDKFEEAYKAKMDEEKSYIEDKENTEDSESVEEEVIKPEDIEPNYSHPLFKQYISEEASLKEGAYNSKLQSRRMSEWSLFQTGYYDVLGKWEAGGSSAGILRACEEVMYDLLNNNVQYTVSNLTSQDIELSLDFTRYGCCCATYATAVMYRAGTLTREHINQYNYNWCDDSAFKAMMRESGWTRIYSPEEAEAGDVCVYDKHAFIYAGDGYVWDQSCGCISSSGNPPARGPVKTWNCYKDEPTLEIWRVP